MTSTDTAQDNRRTDAAGTPEPGRSRVIHAEGDGRAVFRTASRYNATAAVYVAPEGERARVAEHPAVSLTVTPAGVWTLTHELGGWGQVPPVVLAVGHVDQPPAVVRADGQDSTLFAWVIDGEIHRGTVGALAGWAASERMGYADDPVPAFVYAPTTAAGLVPVPVRVECGRFDAAGFADLVVMVDLGAAGTVTGFARVDGNA